MTPTTPTNSMAQGSGTVPGVATGTGYGYGYSGTGTESGSGLGSGETVLADGSYLAGLAMGDSTRTTMTASSMFFYVPSFLLFLLPLL